MVVSSRATLLKYNKNNPDYYPLSTPVLLLNSRDKLHPILTREDRLERYDLVHLTTFYEVLQPEFKHFVTSEVLNFVNKLVVL